MPAEFQKALDLILTNCENTYAFPDDIPIVTARGQPQQRNGYRSGYSGESHQNRRAYAAISSETPESTGSFIHRRSHQEGQKTASFDKLCEKSGTGTPSKPPTDNIGSTFGTGDKSKPTNQLD